MEKKKKKEDYVTPSKKIKIEEHHLPVDALKPKKVIQPDKPKIPDNPKKPKVKPPKDSGKTGNGSKKGR